MLEFFKNKKVIITGHTGFKGSWLTLWLHKIGADVTGISLDPKTKDDAFYAMNIKNSCKDLRIDIRDYTKILEVFNAVQPEIVFHLAAQPLVLESYKNPLYTYSTNVMGTVNILEAVRETKSIRQAVLITTDKVYENREFVWGYRENDPLGGYEPYGTSKAAAEMVIAGYKNSFFASASSDHPASVASVRAGNVIGGGDWAENRIVPDCIRAIYKGETILVRNPDAVRPWQHVIEALGGYLLLCKKMGDEPGKHAQAYNFGPGIDGLKPVKELVDKIINTIGKGSWESIKTVNSHYESGLLALDISKSYVNLGWKPQLSFSETIEWTADWYKDYFGGKNMNESSLKQLSNYEKILRI